MTLSGDDVRFQIKGHSISISGISLLCDDDTIHHVQIGDPILNLLRFNIASGVPTNLWSEEPRPFIRHASKLSISHDILIYHSITSIIVVPFEIALDLALSFHYNFAHVGRDKVLDLMSHLVWHPANYKIANDVCTTCHQCQINKSYSHH